MDTKSDFDLIIIGCGIAGASLAYFLTEQGMKDILILEKEEQPGYHATGRSAAVLVEFDMIPSVLELKLIGAQCLRTPPTDFSENPFASRGSLSWVRTLYGGRSKKLSKGRNKGVQP
jgi:D-arginine dehydrogenase